MVSSASLRRRAVAASLLVLSAGALAACADDIGPQGYNSYAAGSFARVEEGVTVEARPIHFNGRDNGAGTVGGAVVGGVIGSQVGGWRDRGAFTVLGALGGALAGNAISSSAQDRNGFVYTIRRVRDGSLIQVPQADQYPIAQGTRVYISYGDRVRVQPVGPGAPPPPPPGYYRDAPPPPPRY